MYSHSLWSVGIVTPLKRLESFTFWICLLRLCLHTLALNYLPDLKNLFSVFSFGHVQGAALSRTHFRFSPFSTVHFLGLTISIVLPLLPSLLRSVPLLSLGFIIVSLHSCSWQFECVSSLFVSMFLKSVFLAHVESPTGQSSYLTPWHWPFSLFKLLFTFLALVFSLWLILLRLFPKYLLLCITL